MGMNSMWEFICLILCAACCCCAAANPVAPSDVQALRAFASGIRDDPAGVLKSWATADEEACSWEGVECTWIYSSRAFRVVTLRLSGFLLEGTISPRLGRLSELRTLDLSENRFSGHIPAELAALPKLQDVDLSSNRLSGSIPPGKSFKEAGFLGNSELCGWPLDRKCPSWLSLLTNFFWRLISSSVKTKRSSILPSWQSALRSSRSQSLTRRALLDGAPAPAPAPQNSRGVAAPVPSIAAKPKHKRSKVKRWGIGAALGIAVGSLGGILLGSIGRVAVLIYKNSRKKQGPIIFHSKITPKMLTFLNSAESFEQMEVLGSGGAGKVYKATLENGLLVAIKRILIQQPPQDAGSSTDSKASSFGKRHTVAEMETLGKIRHNNLAWLYAYIRKPDAHLLLYQFMPQGSLQDVMARVRAGALDLDWRARQRIAIGIATGLKYLHFDCTPKILHRDLKTSNILLNDDLEAHLGDFGLAKALPDEMTHVTTGVAGTIGYIAPEYNQTMKFTTSSDVYSFGIILGVLLVGKEPTDDFFCNFPGGIVSFMCSLVQTGQELKGLDPMLIKAPPEENMATPGSDAGTPLLSSAYTQPNEIAEMKLALRIACLCTKPNPGDRPSSKDLLVMLNPGKLATVRPMEELIKD